MLYRRAMATLGVELGIEKLYASAGEAYFRGDYRGSTGLTPQIDQQCAAVVRSGRAVVLVGGVVFGVCGLWVLKLLRRRTVLQFVCGSAMLIGVFGAGAYVAWMATAAVTQQESLIAAGLVGGAATVVVIGTFVYGSWRKLARRSGDR